MTLFVEDVEADIYNKLQDDNKSTSEEERDLDQEIQRLRQQTIHDENEPIMNKIEIDHAFLHRFLFFLASLKVCMSCGVKEEANDGRNLLIV